MGKNLTANAGDARDSGLVPRSGRSPGVDGIWQPTPVILPEKSHGQRSPAGHSPQSLKELNMTEQAQLDC